MEITSSYQVEILSNTDMKNTVQIYRRALAFVIDVCNREWGNISVLGGTKEKDHYVEKLIHPTKNNPNPKYPFDIKGSEFYKFPSYLKRAVIAEAIGAVSSYRSNYKNWEDNGKKGNAPVLQMDRHAMPVFYNKNMYKEDAPKNAKYPKGMNPCKDNIRWLKLYQNNDWVWIPVRLRKTDIDYINKYWGACEDKSAPTLEKIHNKYQLRFSFTETVTLSDTPIAEQIICAVDLGINTDAVCSIMKADGTILARKFIDFASDKDRMIHAMNRTRRKQSKYGPKSARGLWAYVKRLNEDRAKKISAAIVEFASQHSVDTIVMEHLDFKGCKKRGSKAQRLSMWNHGIIREKVEQKAHLLGIRIATICAWKTSALAFDGSGSVTRDDNNHALAKFTTGKQYNCDLSASYNIGARYFIRELLKSLPATEESRVKAKVPDVGRRTSCTLSTLRMLVKELSAAQRCICPPVYVLAFVWVSVSSDSEIQYLSGCSN